MGTRRLGGWCATPNVETQVTFGVSLTRVASRGSGAMVAVRSQPSGSRTVMSLDAAGDDPAARAAT